MSIESRIRKLEEKQTRQPVRFYLVNSDGTPVDPTQELPKDSGGTFLIVDPPFTREELDQKEVLERRLKEVDGDLSKLTDEELELAEYITRKIEYVPKDEE